MPCTPTCILTPVSRTLRRTRWALLDGVGHGLLAVDVLARASGVDGYGRVEMSGCDDHEVNVHCPQSRRL
jgi:hypothetical protein